MIDEQIPVNCGCGGEAKIDYVLQPDGIYMVNVYCKNCGTKTIPFWAREKDLAIDYAVTTWNKAMGKDKRSDLTITKGYWMVTNDGLHCSICNYKLDITAVPDICPHCGARMRGG